MSVGRLGALFVVAELSCAAPNVGTNSPTMRKATNWICSWLRFDMANSPVRARTSEAVEALTNGYPDQLRRWWYPPEVARISRMEPLDAKYCGRIAIQPCNTGVSKIMNARLSSGRLGFVGLLELLRRDGDNVLPGVGTHGQVDRIALAVSFNVGDELWIGVIDVAVGVVYFCAVEKSP